ncbi:kinase-like domain-containing protein [Suillus occidentalis]|nr:kinase-like domain-containing protein [Suillus occidentalis]
MELEMSFQTAKYVCFAMDLMTNDLAYYIDNEYEYCLENARRWSAQVALGINALHAMGIIHRDIKSENILIDIQENVRIADFGLSHIDKEPKPLHAWRGYSSEVKGTIDFMAPEILRNVKEPLSVKYGAPVDWWAFGCVIYELELFVSEDDITKYVAWHSKNHGKFGVFPSFQRLDPIAGDLVAKLLNPLVELRFGFQQVTNHRYFSNGDGTSEFHGACSRGRFDSTFCSEERTNI